MWAILSRSWLKPPQSSKFDKIHQFQHSAHKDAIQSGIFGCPCIGLEIGFGHILCVISFLDIDIMVSLSIGIWNWIGVYLRSCLSSKMSKLFFLWLVMVNPGHISFADIFGSLSLH